MEVGKTIFQWHDKDFSIRDGDKKNKTALSSTIMGTVSASHMKKTRGKENGKKHGKKSRMLSNGQGGISFSSGNLAVVQYDFYFQTDELLSYRSGSI